ncbi:MAG: hypothetical protein GY951_06145, partial [Psychromonas sp.]|nr:hypothetical protein [Psychromonas sp.]
ALSGGAFLSGCGGSSSSTSAPTTPSVPETKAFTACIDNNINGSCESHEQSEKLATWGDTSLYSQEFPLALTGEGLVLTAPIASTEISPWTTLLQSETVFSPAQGDLQNYLTQLLDLQQAELSAEQSKALIDSIKKVFNDSSTETRASKNQSVSAYQVLAAITDAVISTKSFDIDSVDLSDVANRTSIKHNWIAQQVAKGALNWVTPEHDEHAVAASAVGERALIATKYHNQLILLDTSDTSNPTLLSHGGFAYVDGERFAVDATTGATEHRLRDAVLSHDAKHVYVFVAATGQRNENYQADLDQGYGLFKATINADGSISDENSDQTIRIADKTISKITTSKDTSIIAALRTVNDEDVISLFDSELVATGVDIVFSGRPTSFTISGDNKSLFATFASQEELGNKIPAKLVKYQLSNGEEIQAMDLDFDASHIIAYDNGNSLAVYKKGEKNISLYDSANLSKIHLLNTGISIQKAEIADDQKTLAVSSRSSADVLIFDLSSFVPRFETSVTPADRVYHLAMAEGLLVLPLELTSFDRGIDTFTIEKGDALTLQQIVDTDMLLLTNNADKIINNGLPLDKVINDDLNLETQLSRGAGANIEWASTLAEIATSGPDQGKVNRPENGEGNLQGILTATITKSFRDQEITNILELATNVWQKPLLPVETDRLITGSVFAGGYYRQLASNYDASRFVAQIYEYETLVGFQLMEVGSDGKLQYLIGAAQVDADTPATGQKYHGDYSARDTAKGVAYLGDHLVFSLSNGNTSEKGALQVFNASDAVMMANEGQAKFVTQIVLDGEIRSSQQQGDFLVVRVKLADDIYQITLVDLTVPSMPKIVATIPLIEGDSTATVNDLADTVYVKNGSSIRKLDLSGNELSKVKLTSGIKSLTYGKDNLFVGTSKGNLYLLDKNLENMKHFITGHDKYTEKLQVIDNSVFMHNRYHGLIQLDISDIDNISEVLFYGHESYRQGIVSPDASRVFTFYYEHRGENGTSSGYIDLK